MFHCFFCSVLIFCHLQKRPVINDAVVILGGDERMSSDRSVLNLVKYLPGAIDGP